MISEKALNYLSKINIPIITSKEIKKIDELKDQIYKKESKARGFHKKQKWNKSLLILQKINFNSKIINLKGKIIMKDEIDKIEKKSLIYEDPILNIFIIFENQNLIFNCRKKCRNNVNLKIYKEFDNNFFRFRKDFVENGNFKILLISTQNMQKDDEIFLDPNFFRNVDEKNVCVCGKDELCLFNETKKS